VVPTPAAGPGAVGIAGFDEEATSGEFTEREVSTGVEWRGVATDRRSRPSIAGSPNS